MYCTRRSSGPVVRGAIELLYTPVDRRVQANYLILVEYCPTRLVFGNPLAVTETLWRQAV